MNLKGRGVKVGQNLIDIQNNYIVNSILQRNNNVIIQRADTSLTQIFMVQLNAMGVTELHMPQLATVDYGIVLETGDLQDFSFPSLQVVGTSFNILKSSKSGSVNLSSLQVVGSVSLGVLSINECPNITDIDLSSLTDVNIINIQDNPSLTNIDIQNLTNVVDNTLDISRNQALGTITVHMTNLQCSFINFSDNALTQTNVDDILIAVDNAGLTGGELYLDGGSTQSPTGGFSNAEYLSLLGKGWTVNIN